MNASAKGLKNRIESLTPAGLWLAVVGTAAGAAALVVVAGSLVLQDSALWVGWKPVLVALGVVAFVPVIGMWPLGACNPGDSERISKAAYMGTPIRMGTALILGLPVLLGMDRTYRAPFGIWLGGLYLVSLAAEIVLLVVWLRGRGGSART